MALITGAGLMVSAVLTVSYTIPTESLLSFAQCAALLSAGLRHPEGSVQVLDEWMTRPTADAGNSTTLPEPSAGITQPLSTTAAPSTAPTEPTKAGNDTASGSSGRVLTQQLSAGSDFVQGVAIQNKSGKTVDIAASLKHVPALSLSKTTDKPQVLIVHTHTTECYLQRDDGTYRAEDVTRSADNSRNMVAVGAVIAAQLKQAGIGVIHDTAVHDNPYSGAYSRSAASIKTYLKTYPTIRVVLDIHRDAIYPADNVRVKPTVKVNGKAAAQVMMIVGMRNTSATPNPHTADNLALGVRLQQQLHREYPGLVRPLSLVDARYNQQLTNGSLLIEVGSDANTLEEALYAGELVGNGVATVLKALGA